MSPLVLLYQLGWIMATILGGPLLAKRSSPWLYKRWLWDPTPYVLPKDKRCIWIHALSLGELFSVERVLGELKKEFPEYPIVMTVGTEKAFQYLKSQPNPHLNGFVHMPLDFFVSVKRLLRIIRPKIALMVESDLWPFVLWSLKEKGIPILVINGRLSPRSIRHYRRFRFLMRELFYPVTQWIMQSELDVKRLSSTGAVDPSKVISIGNLKFDAPLLFGDEKRDWSKLLSIREEDKIWVGGSTHPNEEEILLRVFKRLRGAHPSLRLIIGPRDVSRAKEIVTMVEKEGFNGCLRSHVPKESCFDVLVIDTIGELRQIYQVAHVAFVGGSLVRIGGHNILEPAEHGVPVIFGPHTFNFEEMTSQFLDLKAGIRVLDEEGLFGAVSSLLRDSSSRREMGERGRAICASHRGAAQRLLRIIANYLNT